MPFVLVHDRFHVHFHYGESAFDSGIPALSTSFTIQVIFRAESVAFAFAGFGDVPFLFLRLIQTPAVAPGERSQASRACSMFL